MTFLREMSDLGFTCVSWLRSVFLLLYVTLMLGKCFFVILCSISDCPCIYGSVSVCVIVLSAFGAALFGWFWGFGCAGAGGFAFLATYILTFWWILFMKWLG